ncbi:MAG: dephospho-CoA kinase [Ruminococcus sp.]|nr:dephospho-CoA kinase [Ruminococcus sp.]
MSKNIVVGLTGPIGSGKSAVAKIFCENGFKLIDADELAREITQKSSPVLKVLAENFGTDVINNDGTLNRLKLAQKAFKDKESTDALNAITHPAILALVKQNIADFFEKGESKVIYDAPLLFESKSDSLCDKVVCVIAKKQERISRVRLRDNMSEHDIKNRISAQHDDSFYIDKADYVIENNSTYSKLLENTLKVIEDICEVHDGAI